MWGCVIKVLFLLGSSSLLFALFAGEAIQTDWSGGPGIWGPVFDFGTEFCFDTDVRWVSPGVLELDLCGKFSVDSLFDGVGSIVSNDIDGDGDMDIVGAAFDIDEFAWWENVDGNGRLWSKHTIDATSNGARDVYAEDMNNDGYVDVLGTVWWSNDVCLWKNVDGTGLVWEVYYIDSDFDLPEGVCAADVDGDGDMDALGAAYQDRDIVWWENTEGTGEVWLKHIIDGEFRGAISVYAEDMDDDGDMDVLGAAHYYDNDITWWENADGTGTSWIEHVVDDDYNGAVCVYAADIDGDDDSDVLGAAIFAGELTWWENTNGIGTAWTEHVITQGCISANSIFAEDMDDDGDQDVLSTSYRPGSVSFWENEDGSGSSWIEHVMDQEFVAASSVCSADIDGNGELDIVGTADIDGDVAWWDIGGYSPMGSLESSVLDTQSFPQWAAVDWTGSEPYGTNLYFQYRSADDPDSLGDWSDPVYYPCNLSGLLYRYVQYRVILESANRYSTAVLYDFTLNWDPVGVEESTGPLPTGIELLPVTPNPSSGASSVCFGIPEPMLVRIAFIDLSGHVIATIDGEYIQGYHSIQMEGLVPGVYFCRVVSGVFTDTQRFVVIE